MSSSTTYLDYMLTKALVYQQEFYELLPDWTVYRKDEVQYLKQNIGFAIFGPPRFEQNSTSNNIVNYKTRNTTDDTEITDVAYYKFNAEQTINVIVDQIMKHGCMPNCYTIRCGIIYLILIDNDSSVQYGKQKNIEHIALPLFKILKYEGSNEVSAIQNENYNYTTWYIDVKGRIYKSWDDFMTSNDLPKCVMVYPKDGFYQPDPNFDITPNRSTVWIVAQDSYACSTRATVYSVINTTVNTINKGASQGLAVAAVFAPAFPLIAAAGLINTACGIWTIGTCSMDLYDKFVHEESISLCNKSALSSWLGIAGCTVGLGVSAGSYYISKAAASGETVGRVSKMIYDTALVGSISINLIGLGYQGYNIYKKYQEIGTIEMKDVLYFGTHLLFFMNSSVNIKFSNEIIEMTQGKVLKEYETSLRDDNLRKRYNYIKNKAAATTADKIEQNAAVIRYLNKFDKYNIPELPIVNNCFQSLRNISIVQDYNLKFNGITLIDPLLFVVDFAKSFINQTFEEPSPSHSKHQSGQLKKVLEKLLSDFYTSRDCPETVPLYTVPDFQVIINELKKVKNSEDILPFIFNIALILMKRNNLHNYFIEACHFVWDYIKRNMRGMALEKLSQVNSSNAFVRQIQVVVVALFDAMDSLANRFLNAFYQYLHLTQKLTHDNSNISKFE